MGGTLIRQVSGASGIGYGVNIWELAPPKQVAGVSSNVVAMVADLPWGPVNSIQTITTPGEFWSTFYPNAFGGGAKDSVLYPAILALLNKPIFTRGGLKVVRIAATDQATSAFTFEDATTADSVTVTAKYPGLLGDQIKVAWSANADDAAKRDATVSIGADYSVLYEAVAEIVSAALVVNDPGDPYVTFAKAGSATAVPAAIAATSLAGGDDGTAVAADYVGTSSSIVGIRQFYGSSVKVSVLFVAECPEALKAAVNTGLKAWCTDTDKGVAVLCTVDGQASADAITYMSSYRDDRLQYTWPRVKTVNFFDADAAETEVDGNAFAAALIANVDPWLSPGGAGKRQGTTDLLAGITGLEDETASDATLAALNAAGIAPWFMSNKLGAIMHRAVTTSITAGLTKLFRRRMTDFLLNSIAEFSEEFVETPLDVTLEDQSLGPNTSGYVGAITDFLEGQKQAVHLASYSVDAFSENTQPDIDAGRFTLAIAVKLISMMEEIVLKASIGETVTVSES